MHLAVATGAAAFVAGRAGFLVPWTSVPLAPPMGHYVGHYVDTFAFFWTGSRSTKLGYDLHEYASSPIIPHSSDGL